MTTPHERFGALVAFSGLKHTAFAKRLGCSAQMVGMIERGIRTPGVDIVHAIERESFRPREDGVVWPGGPLLTEEWIGQACRKPVADAPPANEPVKGDADTAA